MSRRTLRALGLSMVVALALAACGGGDGGDDDSASGSETTAPGGGGDLPECPVDALEGATAPVEITMWHAMPERNGATLEQLAEQYNASQQRVKVTLTQFPTYDDVFQKFQASLTTGDLAPALQLEDTNLQVAIDSGAVIPVQSCIDAEGYDMSDTIERVVDYFTVDDVLWPMPFNASNPLLYYDKSDFRRAGLDPEDPPTTLAEIRTAAEALKEAGIREPITFGLDSWYFEQMRAVADVLFVDNDNGRTAPTEGAVFDDEVGEGIFTWLSEMAADDLLFGYDKDSVDNLLAIANGNASMTIYTSAALGTAKSILQSGGTADKEIELGAVAMPSPVDDRPGGVMVGGAALYISARATPEQQAAAWDWLKFLNSVEAQAIWGAGTGYVPIREGAADTPTMQQVWADDPEFKIAYDALVEGENTPATAGSVMGAYLQVRDAVIAGLESVVQQGGDPATALAEAKQAADEAIEAYNRRAGN